MSSTSQLTIVKRFVIALEGHIFVSNCRTQSSNYMFDQRVAMCQDITSYTGQRAIPNALLTVWL